MLALSKVLSMLWPTSLSYGKQRFRTRETLDLDVGNFEQFYYVMKLAQMPNFFKTVR